MSQKYRDKRTKQFADGERVKAFQAFERQAYKRLEILEAAPNKEALMMLPSNRFEALGGIAKANTVFALTIDGGFALNGLRKKNIRLTSRLWIITKGETFYDTSRNPPRRDFSR